MPTYKLYISQPMRDKSAEQIEAARQRAVQMAKSYVDSQLGIPEGERKIEVIDSFFKGAPHDAKPLWSLGRALQEMSSADIVFFASAWATARGCRIENLAAHEYLEKAGVIIIEEPYRLEP